MDPHFLAMDRRSLIYPCFEIIVVFEETSVEQRRVTRLKSI